MDWNRQKIPNQDLGEGTMVDLPALLSTNLSKGLSLSSSHFPAYLSLVNQ